MNAPADHLTWLPSELVRELVQEHGSPLYVYHEPTLRTRCREVAGMLPGRDFHPSVSIKTNGNPSLLAIARQEGLGGDAMSPGEILLLERAGFCPEEIFFIPNNVSREELEFARDRGILTSLDSVDQVRLAADVFAGGQVALRINPLVGDGHHGKVVTAGARVKFGILPSEVPQALEILSSRGVEVVGLNQHIGSGFLTPERYLQAAKALLEVCRTVPSVRFADFGGGFGIGYRGEPRLDLSVVGSGLSVLLDAWERETGRCLRAQVEPGRYVFAECGAVLGTVHAVKEREGIQIAGCDIGFNVLQRPVLYDSYHGIDLCPREKREGPRVDVEWVGNICESGDILGRDRKCLLPELGDHLVVRDAGAYGWAMSSSYNARPRAAEVLLGKDGSVRRIRRRETWEDLLAALP
ncbi:MAG: diaminopimelate decarboxylase [Fibrobacterota bacterium]|nr:MAG: diaminopimelate decarboxylase [Fibrobacterota bacterium]